MTIKSSLAVLALAASIGACNAVAQSPANPANLSDVEIAHVAYVADNIDIRYAHLALAISDNPDIHKFAKTMIRDHTAVNEQALALLGKLKAKPKNNFLSRSLQANSVKLIDKMSKLRGAAFDKFYAKNELAYHKAVNELVEKTFIPNIDHPEVKSLFRAGLKIFKVHEGHAKMMLSKLN